jgi:CubicO group peptidase (beta-lactamase class C family)
MRLTSFENYRLFLFRPLGIHPYFCSMTLNRVAGYFLVIVFLCAGICSCQDDSKKQIGDGIGGFSMPVRKLSRKQQFEAYRLDTLFTLLYNSGAFNGNVLLAQNDTIVYQKSFGYADREQKIFLHDSSAFQLASVSKTITSAAVLILVDKGVVKLEDPVTKYIDGFPWPKVNVKHLLTHRSGLPNYIYMCSPLLKERKCCFNNEEMICLLDSAKPKEYYDPGDQFNYSNTNYFLLASIIERATGNSYGYFVKKNIFEPLGMKNTFLATDTAMLNSNRETHGYTFKWTRVNSDPYDGVLGDKGIYSTTGDMLQFANAFFSAKLFSKKLLDEAIAPHSPDEKNQNYGYGWRMMNFEEKNPEKIVYHNGWWHGYRNAFQRRLKDNTTLIILSNRLNKSVYATWRVFKALDGLTDTTGLQKQLVKDGESE